MKEAAAAAAQLPQHDVAWERCYSAHADLGALSADSPGGLLVPMESDLGDAPAEITPAEQQDAETGVVLKPKRSPHLPTEEERRAHEVSHVPCKEGGGEEWKRRDAEGREGCLLYTSPSPRD